MKYLLLIGFMFFVLLSNAQYILNGNAVQDATCNCYKLTEAQNTQAGSIWNINKLNLNNSFDFKFDVYFGTNDANGADGIAFILQPISTSLGMSGGGLGYQGIVPSVGILMDTWQNTNFGDPNFDYISIQKNGIINHSLNQDLSAPVQANATSINIEDGQYHNLRIKWDQPTKNLIVYFDGVERHNTIVDMVADIFGNDPLVFWGFTAATGGANNVHKICTRLSPNFSFNSASNTYCKGTSVSFNESSDAFAPITNWAWDFGDGTSFIGQQPPPKIYAATGNFTVSLTVSGIDGCVSTPFTQNISIVEAPTSKMAIQPILCANQTIQFTDISSLNNSGATTSWLWQFSDGTTSNLQNPIKTFSAANNFNVRFTANNNFGCQTNFKDSVIVVNPTPIVNFTEQPLTCEKDSIVYNAQVNFGANGANNYLWTFSNSTSLNGTNLNTVKNFYANAGSYSASLKATNTLGCADSITKTSTILQKPSFSINPSNVCLNTTVPININASLSGNANNSFIFSGSIKNPTGNIALINSTSTNYNFALSGLHKVFALVTASNGCSYYDSAQIIANTNPMLNFSILKKDTLCAAENIILKNATTEALSLVNVIWNYQTNPSLVNSYANVISGSSIQNAIPFFNAPLFQNDTVKIIGTSNITGCKDSLLLNYTTHAVPTIANVDTVFTCSTSIPFAIEAPTVSPLFNGSYQIINNAVVNNLFYPSNAIEGNNLVHYKYQTSAGCIANAQQIINVQKPLVVNAGNDAFVTQGGQINLNGIAFGAALTGAVFAWSPNNTLQNSNSLTSLCMPTQNQVYTLKATTTNGCISSDSLLISLVLDIEIPNTFTPNNDGINDVWVLKYLNTQPIANIQVFNRYGQNVYNGNANSPLFNGKYNQTDLPDGTYYYIITTKRSKPYKGYVTIIR